MKLTMKLLALFFGVLMLANIANAESPREQMQQLTAQLQKTPNDNALREKIIKLTATLKPAPVVPFEAKRPFVMATTYQKEAKKPSDFALAIAAYQDALKIAPWWGDAYYNLSISLESAGRLDEAKDALALYLLTKPKDAEEAQNRLYALDAKKNLAAKQAAETAAAAVESWFCQWYSEKEVGTFISVDHERRSLTYFERHAVGQDKPAIVSRATITETDISWMQTETFPQQTRQTLVKYSLRRGSGELDYSYTSSSGDPRTNRLNCVKAKP
jgi:tetratricopeptide (TPR) repeat protein